jgi:DNA-3-methyladenine glycosylase
MPESSRLERAFYERATPLVARSLLGQRLVRNLEGQRLSGLITETEAYRGPDDQASHAYRRTPRSSIMYGPAGYAYVYFIYGSYFCLNAVTEAAGQPGAVLIRAVFPTEGLATMRQRRGGRDERRLADGPGKLCQALGIGRALNGADLVSGDDLFLESGEAVPEAEVQVTRRVGVRGDELALLRPWRYMWAAHRLRAT